MARKLTYETPEELQGAITDYFESEQAIHTMSGLALWLGISRQALNDYKVRAGFRDIIEEARCAIEVKYEEQLFTKHSRGAIFALMNNFGWREKSDTTGSLDANVKHSALHPDDRAALDMFNVAAATANEGDHETD